MQDVCTQICAKRTGKCRFFVHGPAGLHRTMTETSVLRARVFTHISARIRQIILGVKTRAGPAVVSRLSNGPERAGLKFIDTGIPDQRITLALIRIRPPPSASRE